jgi:hypothetical protein
MAEIEESLENVDSSAFNGQDFLDSDPPSPEQLLAILEQLTGLTDADRKEFIQEFFKRQERIEPVQQLLTSQFFVLLTLLLTIATVFGKKFVPFFNIRSGYKTHIHF